MFTLRCITFSFRSVDGHNQNNYLPDSLYRLCDPAVFTLRCEIFFYGEYK